MKQYKAVMLPTSNPKQGRWIRYRYPQLYKGPSAICITDILAVREAAQQSGYRMRTSELKYHIKRSLGYKALRD